MADVVNPLNAVTANRQDSGNVVTPESPDANILSPTIKEAMDFILPKSATQLLQQGLSCDQPNHMQNLPETVSNMLPYSVASDAPYPSKITGLITPASGKRSCDQQAESHFNNLNGSSNDSQKKIGKIRISKADLEIITSASDIRMNDFSTETDSDPEDMTRCFKKRKHKKKKRSPKTSPERESSILHNSVLEEDPSSVMGHKLVSELNVKSLTQPLSSRNNELQGTLTVTDSSFDSRLHSSGDKDGSGLRDCQNSFGKTMPKNGFFGDCAIGTEDVSNISTSSSKENVLSQRKPSGQLLPRTKRMEYNIIRHKSKIKNTFLPCFVVLKKCVDSFKVSNSHFDFSSNELSLSIRVKYLLEMCRKGKIDCKKRRLKGVFIVDKPVYKNIFEENILMGASDDEFENTRRSLRKRVKNISYVEPTEDDIMDDFKKKRSRSKAKESGSGHDTDTSQETKRKKTSNNSEELCKNTESAASKLEQMTYTKVGKSANEIIVFPKVPIAKDIIKSHKANENVEDKLKSKIVSNRSNPPQPFDASTSSLRPLMAKSPLAPAPARVSVFSGFPRQRLYSPPAGPIFPINAPQYSTAVTALSAVPNISSITTLSNPMVSSAQPIPMQKHPPQYCVMKVDGKDVLLQLVPSGVGGSVLLQGNKTAPLLSPPLRSTPPISTQAIPVPVCAAQVPTVSSGLFPLLGLPLVNQSVSSTKNNIPLSGFPVISFASGSGFSTPLTARTTLTSATPLAHTSVPLKTTTSLVSVVPSTGMVTTSVIRTTNSTSAAVSSILSTMGAPASKALRSFVADQIRPAVVRPDQVATLVAPGLRAVVPNQTSSLRSIRIFVPGCTNTGTPGRFATLGSIANSSPLTRLSASSDLLPQRKQSHDHELTPEQKAAKRRKLEKKYPLPPGVVIKTEPLESLPPPTVTTAVRSLLSPNIQLVSSVSRPGTTVRIIVPSAANSVASGIRGGQNIVYRASSGGSQTVLTTLGNLTSIVSSLHSPSAAIVSSVTTTATIASSSSTPQNMPKQTNSLEFTSPSSCAPTLTSQSPGIWSPASSLSDNSTKTSGTTSTLTSSAERLPAEKSLTKERLEELKMSLIKLRELVTKQETLGLKGERLDKLKEVLLTKEMEFEKMQKQLEADLNTSGALSQSDLNCLEDVSQSELNCSAATPQEESKSSPDVLQSTLADTSQTGTNSPVNLSESVNTVINAVNMAAANDHLGTEDEPFVID